MQRKMGFTVLLETPIFLLAADHCRVSPGEPLKEKSPFPLVGLGVLDTSALGHPEQIKEEQQRA